MGASGSVEDAAAGALNTNGGELKANAGAGAAPEATAEELKLKPELGADAAAPGAGAGELKTNPPAAAVVGGLENANGADATPNGAGALPAAANDMSALAAGCVEGDVKLNELVPKPPAPCCCAGGVENDEAEASFAGVVEWRDPPPLTRLFLPAAGLLAAGFAASLPSWKADAVATSEGPTTDSNDDMENCDDIESIENAGPAAWAAAASAAAAAASALFAASQSLRRRLDTSSMSWTVVFLFT